jgi:hypothetical protein
VAVKPVGVVGGVESGGVVPLKIFEKPLRLPAASVACTR